VRQPRLGLAAVVCKTAVLSRHLVHLGKVDW
jgi:hypothetical protein